MIKDKDIWEKFEREYKAKEDMSYEEKLKLYDQMWLWAVKMGAMPPEDPLEGIEKDIELARLFKRLAERYERERKERKDS